MNKYLKLIVLILTFVLCGCEKSSGDEPGNSSTNSNIENNEEKPNNPSSSPEYYVKYESVVTSRYTGNIKNTVNTDTGVQAFQSEKSFSQTFGPVKQGFKTYIMVDAGGLHEAECDVMIYVCRGSEPFALKAHKSGGKIVSVSYTIDY